MTKTMSRADFVRTVFSVTNDPKLRQAAEEMPRFACNKNESKDAYCVVAYAQIKFGYDLVGSEDIDIDFAVFRALELGETMEDYWHSWPETWGDDTLEIVDAA